MKYKQPSCEHHTKTSQPYRHDRQILQICSVQLVQNWQHCS